MKKLVWLLTLALGILILTWCTKEVINEEATPETNSETFESTIMEVYKKWWKMTCSMNTTQEGISMNGTIYIDGKKMKTNMKWSAAGMNFEMNSIVKDWYTYTRTNMSNEWRKIVLDEDEQEDIEEGLNDATTDTDMDSPMAFTCKKGIEDGSVFDLPNTIEFKEFSY